jgi:hypothetical protein
MARLVPVGALRSARDARPVLLARYTPPFPESGPTWGIVFAVSLLAYPTVGAFVASRRPKNPIGWVLCGVGFLFGTQGFAIA